MTFPFPQISPTSIKPLVSIAFTAGVLDSPTNTVHTFPSVAIGTPSSFRKVVVGLNYGPSSPEAVSVKIGGVNATLAARRINSWAYSNAKLDLWQANVSTGTTGDIVVTLSGDAAGMKLVVWSAYSLSSTVYNTAGADGPGIAETTSLSVPINVPAGGAALGFFMAGGTQGSSFSTTWTNLTENFDIGTTSGHSGADSVFSTQQTNLIVTAQANNVLPDGLIQLVVASWGPS